MIIQNLSSQKPFITKDGSQIRSILDLTNAPVQNQSLAEATLLPGQATDAHYHKKTEELYFLLEGTGVISVGEESREVAEGDCVLIPPGAIHTIRALSPLRFLCCCAPPYSHEDTFLA